MTTTKTSVATAPRDLEALKKQGRFNLRCLAEELGVFSNEQSKSSFMSMANDAQAENIFKLLKDVDKRNGGGGGDAGGAEEQPVRQPSTKTTSKKNTTPAATSTGASPASDAKIGDGAAKILSAIQEQTAAIQEVGALLKELTQAVQVIDAGTERNIRFTTMAVGLSLKLAEESLNAGADAIIPAVIDDLPIVEKHLAAVAGIAEEDDGEEEEEEDPNA